LGVFWEGFPTDDERRLGAERAGGTERQAPPYNERIEAWEEEYRIHGLKIDLGHFEVATVERILADVLLRSDPALSKQTTVAALLRALPLHGEDRLQAWQARAAAYPAELARAMVREHLSFTPFWISAMFAERDEWLLLRHNLGGLVRQVLLVLLGLNRVYYPGHKWVNRLVEELTLAPRDLPLRLRAIVSEDLQRAVPLLGEVIEETFDLVERHMPEVETAAARSRFREPAQAWDAAPAGWDR
jgi:hypothetical protein